MDIDCIAGGASTAGMDITGPVGIAIKSKDVNSATETVHQFLDISGLQATCNLSACF